MRLKCVFAGCSKSFSCQSKLDDHVNVHTMQRPHACDICGKAYPCKKGLDAHQKVHGEAQHACAHCGRCFVYAYCMHRHAAICQRVFVCEKCGATYQRLKWYKIHMRDKHKPVAKKSRECEQCGMQFSYRSSLVSHTKIVHEGRRVSCRWCGREFSYASSCREHAERCKHSPEQINDACSVGNAS